MNGGTSDVPAWLRELHIIDVDAHISEPWDLWTRHAPAAYKDRLPHVVAVDGSHHWVVDGVSLGVANAVAVVLPDGSKAPAIHTRHLGLDQVHEASYDMRARVKLLDRLGIYAQILYPNVAGFGSQRFMSVADSKVRALSATVYNYAMAEIQETSKGRLFPMALLPWWDIDASLVELRRIARLGFRGVIMASDPQDVGLPDLAQPVWEPLWKACSDLAMPVSFHIGASETSLRSSNVEAPWPSLPDAQRQMIGGMMLFMANARILANLILGGVLEKFPELKVVSVESGIGWIPFMLEAMDYNFKDAPEPFLQSVPSDYFRRQCYACFWFEEIAVERLLDRIGVANVMFETDIPHAVCLYPDVRDHIVRVFGKVDPGIRRRVLQDNAAELYRIDLSKVAPRS